MAYATLTDMIALYGEREVTVCSDWDNSGSLNKNNVNACLSAAADEMDSYLAVRYQLPLDDTAVTDDLVRRNCEIGMWKLCPYATTATELKEKRYKEALTWLLRLSRGEVTLGPGQNLETPAVVTDIEIVSSIGDSLAAGTPQGNALRRIL